MLLRRAAVVSILFLVVSVAPQALLAAVSLAGGSTQAFDSIGSTATATLPPDFRVDKQTSARVVGTWSAALSATERSGGATLSTTAANGIYNFGAGTTTGGDSDRAVGFVSSGTATKSGNLYGQYVNDTGSAVTTVHVAYGIEKYRNGSNPAGFAVALYYSNDGTIWSAVTGGVTAFTADANNNGFATAPGAVVPVSLDATVSVAAGGSFYLAWNYAVASGATTTNAQALAIDDITVTVPAPTVPPATPSTPSAVPGNHHVALTWSSVSGASSYNVKRSTTSGSGYSTIASPAVASYDDTTASNGITYFYVVSAVNVAGESADSSEVSGTPSLPAPVVTATSGDSHVALSWGAVTGATTYSVRRSTTSGGAYTEIATPSAASFDDTTAVNGTQYFYVVAAVDATSTGPLSGEVSATPQAGPSAPTGLAASAGDSHVALTWNSAAGATTYNVKRSMTSGSGYTTLASPATNAYDDTTAANGTTYYYVVSAVNIVGESSDSAEVSATPAPIAAAPTGLAALPGNNRVTLSWSASSGAASYTVKRATVSGGSYTTVASGVVPTSYTDSTALNGTTYFYVVSAVNGSGESANSTEVSATPVPYADVVISQVFGGGGNGAPPFANDYIEIFNRGASTVDLTGFSLQYGSAAGNFASFAGNLFAFPSGTTIGAGKYLTVKTGPAAASGATFTADFATATTDLNMSGASGKVALANVTVALGCGASATPCALPDTRIVDLVAYGAANNGEGATSVNNGVAISATQAAERNSSGCTDTDNNNADFTVVTLDGTVPPRTASAPANLCGPLTTNHRPVISAPANPVVTVIQNAAPFAVSLTGFDDNAVYNWSATPGYGVVSANVSGGAGTGAVTYTVTLQSGFYGTASFTATLSDGVTAPVSQLVNIQVTPDSSTNNPPLIAPPADPIKAVPQDAAPFTVNLSGNDDHNVYNWTATPGAGVSAVNVTAGAGTSSPTFTVTLTPGFSGTATFTATLTDEFPQSVNQTVNIAVQALSHLVISQLYGGGGNSGATYRNDFVEIYNPTATTFDVTGWSIQYQSAGSTSAFGLVQSLGGTIAPGQRYLVSMASGGTDGADLPAANAYGDINMSATAGKVVLVSNNVGATGCTDPDVVDLVGYGSGVSCSETAAAPAPSNTTAIFRKNSGSLDTDNNSTDFTTGTPVANGPTAPIVEIGPSIVSTDPATSASSAPRDANIVINFSEPVTLDAAWFNISCATTGVHNDATVAQSGTRSWTIVPNANFQPGEQCTVTIYRNSVHDVDTDDSAPNTDTLTADYVWTFTVSTGAAPPYSSSVHLTMGNPSNAVNDPAVPNNYLMEKPEYAESYSRDLGRPNWVSWHLASEWYGSTARVDSFRADPLVLPTWYRVLGSDFSGSGFDRGHMCPNADRDSTVPIMQSTFLMSNMIAQAPDNNQGPWANFEAYLRTLTDAGDELYIVSGPYGIGGTGSNGFATTIDNGHVTVPARTWKVVMVLSKAGGDDVARVTASTRTIAVDMPNIQGIRTGNTNDWQTYLTTVDAVETMTGYDFFSNVPPSIQNSIEAGTNGTNPPGAGNETVTTAEDTARAITLDGATPGGALTYTIVTAPAHGSLSGSGASQTYTPVPDYYGADSFTYKVNDGSKDSNTATVSITVTDVNDAPVAVDDAITATTGVALTLPASALTANDSAGPNEAAQTLTVTSVAPTAQTNGTVSLSSGQITYTSNASYSGPATFTYQVCDNGTTNGSPAPLCTTATVNVTVSAFTCPPPPPSMLPVTVAPAVCQSSSGNTASVAAGFASYNWQVTNATITGGQGTSSITFTASSTGTVTFNVATTTSTGCPGQAAYGSTQIQGPPTATLPKVVHTCAGVSTRIPVSLTGRAPFTIVWSDGMQQTGITSTTTSRQYAISSVAKLSIVSVSDASCSTGTGSSTTIVIDGPPVFDHVDANVRVPMNTQATLVVSVTPSVPVTWYQGPVGDVSHPVGTGQTFVTPQLHETTSYWVQAAGTCVTVNSEQITVTVGNPRRRAVGH